MTGEEEKKNPAISQVRCQKTALGPKAGQPEEAGCDTAKIMIKTESAVLSAL